MAWDRLHGKTKGKSKEDDDSVALPAEVSLPTPAGIDSFDKMKESDPFVLKVKLKLAQDSKLTFDETLLEEVKNYFLFSKVQADGAEQRPVPTNFDSEKDLQDMSRHFEACQAYKDRTVRVLLNATALKRELERLWKLAKAYSYTKYAPFFQNGAIKSEEQRASVCANVFEELAKRLDDVSLLVETCEMVLDNLTNTHFSLKEIKEVGIRILEALTNRRKTV